MLKIDQRPYSNWLIPPAAWPMLHVHQQMERTMRWLGCALIISITLGSSSCFVSAAIADATSIDEEQPFGGTPPVYAIPNQRFFQKRKDYVITGACKTTLS